MECEANLRKAKQAYIARCEEYDKAKTAACRAEEEGGGSTAKSVEKKKRVEEEARNKVLLNNFVLLMLFCLCRKKDYYIFVAYDLYQLKILGHNSVTWAKDVVWGHKEGNGLSDTC